LEHMNFLQRDVDSGKYVVGLATLELAAGATLHGDLRSVVAPILVKLVRQWNETCHLGILDGENEILLQRLDPPEQVVRLATQIGRRHPAYASAGGLAALALPPGQVVVDQLPDVLPQVTKNTIKTRVDLEARLNEIRTKGYALDMEEVYPGVRCVGVSVSVPGWPTVAISFSLPRQRASLERLRMLAKPLIAASKEIEALLAVTPNCWGN
jgi:DNA-binding IclR family transcriptional regulator